MIKIAIAAAHAKLEIAAQGCVALVIAFTWLGIGLYDAYGSFA